jgi:hypothetical protein
MVRMLTSGSIPGQVKLQTIKLVFAASLLSRQHQGVRTKTGWLRMRIISASVASCLSVDCCFSELAR